ncbi:MAG: ATP-binding protein [Nanoarchaeota archaeon]
MSNIFYNRRNELISLEEIFNFAGKKPQFLMIYGRRRIGKTILAEEFIKNKKALYFFIGEKEKIDLLNEFSDIIFEKFKEEIYQKPKFSSFEEFFELIFKLSQKEKLIIVLDEFQNFMNVDKSVFSTLQKLWDKYNHSKVMLIVIGSYVGLMKRLFRDSKKPLFGRLTQQINLKQFSFRDSFKVMKSLKKLRIKEAIEVYSFLGGIVKYIIYLEEYWKNINFFIENCFLKEFAPLREEGRQILSLEFGRYRKSYFSILEAISLGNTKPIEISNKTGLKILTINKYLYELTNEYEFLEKITPVTENELKTRKVFYKIKDNFFNFWFRFIYKNLSKFESKDFSYILEDIKQNLNAIVGFKFEDICKEFLINSKSFNFSKIGTWWGHYRDKENKRNEIEIDLIALNENTKEITFCECKWRDKVDAKKILNELKEKVKFVNWNNKNRKEKYCIFAKSFKEKIKEQNLTLFDLKDLENLFN